VSSALQFGELALIAVLAAAFGEWLVGLLAKGFKF